MEWGNSWLNLGIFFSASMKGLDLKICKFGNYCLLFTVIHGKLGLMVATQLPKGNPNQWLIQKMWNNLRKHVLQKTHRKLYTTK
jgi:hypothetical protein